MSWEFYWITKDSAGVRARRSEICCLLIWPEASAPTAPAPPEGLCSKGGFCLPSNEICVVGVVFFLFLPLPSVRRIATGRSTSYRYCLIVCSRSVLPPMRRARAVWL